MTPDPELDPKSEPGAAMKLTNFGLALLVLLALAIAARFTGPHANAASNPTPQNTSQQKLTRT